MDKFTWSDSKAAQNLVKTLELPEYKAYCHKVGGILSRWFEYSSALMVIESEMIRMGSLNLWRQHFLNRVNSSNLPPILVTHLCNVIVAQYRKCRTRTRKCDNKCPQSES